MKVKRKTSIQYDEGSIVSERVKAIEAKRKRISIGREFLAHRLGMSESSLGNKVNGKTKAFSETELTELEYVLKVLEAVREGATVIPSTEITELEKIRVLAKALKLFAEEEKPVIKELVGAIEKICEENKHGN